MTKNIFLDQFKAKSKSELLEILAQREKHTSEAIDAVGILLKEKYADHPDIQQLEINKPTFIEKKSTIILLKT